MGRRCADGSTCRETSRHHLPSSSIRGDAPLISQTWNTVNGMPRISGGSGGPWGFQGFQATCKMRLCIKADFAGCAFLFISRPAGSPAAPGNPERSVWGNPCLADPNSLYPPHGEGLQELVLERLRAELREIHLPALSQFLITCCAQTGCHIKMFDRKANHGRWDEGGTSEREKFEN